MMDAINSVAPSLSVRVEQNAPIPLDVAFTAHSGEVLALVGPSGSGKTTTLRMIAGLATPKAGRIALGDTVWFDAQAAINIRPEQRRIGYVFQDYALFPHLTVLDGVRLAMRHVAREDQTAASIDILTRVGIARLAQRRPRDLSGGERQRVGIARALARDPVVLLLDEPFSAVDRPTREQLKREVKDLTASLSIPTLFVTHDIDEAVALAQRMVVIDSGRTIADAVPSELRRHPPTTRIAEIIGTDTQQS
jgi:molybdate transport system ATP-binding protein